MPAGGKMIKFDAYTKLVLSIIALCLVVLVIQVATPIRGWVPAAQADTGMGKINYAKDGGVGVACSNDGKYVYVAGTEGFMRSEDFGRLGSWEKTIKED